MGTAEMELEITRLKMRTALLQSLLLQTMLFAPGAVPPESLRANQQRSLQLLDDLSRVLALAYLSPQTNPGMTDAQRALHAEELHEIVEQMKSYITSIKK